MSGDDSKMLIIVLPRVMLVLFLDFGLNDESTIRTIRTNMRRINTNIKIMTDIML